MQFLVSWLLNLMFQLISAQIKTVEFFTETFKIFNLIRIWNSIKLTLVKFGFYTGKLWKLCIDFISNGNHGQLFLHPTCTLLLSSLLLLLLVSLLLLLPLLLLFLYLNSVKILKYIKFTYKFKLMMMRAYIYLIYKKIYICTRKGTPKYK